MEQLNVRPDVAPASGARWTSAAYSTVQQQDYTASVWLSKKEKLEYSQQKCIVIFALVCCFGILVALIFSAVDVLGEDGDGITEDNCSKNCKVVFVENIPEDISISHEGTVPLATGLQDLLDLAQKSVEIVSPWWALNTTEQGSRFPQAKQGRLLLHQLMGLKKESVHLKVASDLTQSRELDLLTQCGAEVRYLNMTALTNGKFHSSFWVVDRKHMYIGSAGMNWKSLSTLKELGVIIYNCSCLVLDLHRVFSLYWQLQYRDFVPSIWSRRLFGMYSKDKPLELLLNGTDGEAYVSSSPDLFCPKDRTRDIDAIFHIIQNAKSFIYISMTDYVPLLNNEYWSQIDGTLRQAMILRRITVRLLISCREEMHPVTPNFLWSLKSLCMETSNCTAEAKLFSPRLRDDGSLQGINHHRYMVTDNSLYIGNFDWIGNEFVYNAGVGLVLRNGNSGTTTAPAVVRLQAVFNRDWQSTYSKTLYPSTVHMCTANAVFPEAHLKDYAGSTDQEHSPNTSL